MIPKPRKPTSATTATAVKSMEASRRKDEEAARRMAVMRPKMILMTVNGGLGTLADWDSRGWTGVPGCACFSMTRRAGLACGPFGGDALRGCPPLPRFLREVSKRLAIGSDPAASIPDQKLFRAPLALIVLFPV